MKTQLSSETLTRYFQDVRQTRGHWYPTWILLVREVPPALVHRTAFTPTMVDLLLERGEAVPVQQRHDKIAACIHMRQQIGMSTYPSLDVAGDLFNKCMSHWALQFRSMLARPEENQDNDWVSFLSIVAEKAATVFILDKYRPLVSEYRIRTHYVCGHPPIVADATKSTMEHWQEWYLKKGREIEWVHAYDPFRLAIYETIDWVKLFVMNHLPEVESVVVPDSNEVDGYVSN